MARVGRRNKSKFVLCKELIILVVVLVAMIITTVCLSLPSSSEKELAKFNDLITEYNTANGTSYATLEEGHVFRMANLDDVANAINDSKGTEEDPKYTYILYGSLSNGTVIQYLSKINDEAKNREVSTVLLYSSSKVDDQEDKDDEEFLSSLHKDEEVFNKDVLDGIDEVDLLNVPALLVYKNGELIFNSETIITDGSYNWYIVISKAFAL